MQSQVPAHEIPAPAVAALLLAAQSDAPLTERQMAKLCDAWLEHQINPLGDLQGRGVPYSALNE